MRVAAVRLFVDDLQQAGAFYGGALGLAPTAGGTEGWVVHDGGGVDIVVEEVGADADAEDRALVGRFSGVSLAVADIDAAHARLLAAGVRRDGPPQRQPWGGVLLTVADPSGNRLQLVQYPA